MTIPEIHRDELVALIRHNDAILVEALPEHVYAQGHLPGAINIRPRRVDELAPTLLPDRHARIVVYCGSATCDASLRVAQRLHQLGYHNVHRYTAGNKTGSPPACPSTNQQAQRETSTGTRVPNPPCRSCARPLTILIGRPHNHGHEPTETLGQLSEGVGRGR